MAAEASRSVPPADCYIGSLINLISKFEIRYEGILFYINPEEASIGLGNGSSLDLFQYRASLLLVRSFGTEGRKKDGPQVPPNEKIYEYILFRGSDIKDLHVKFMAPALEEYINNDLAIIQSHCSPMEPASNSSGRGTLSNQSSQEALLGNSRFTVQGGLPHNQSEKNLKSWGSALCVSNSFGPEIPFHLPKFSSPISGISFLQQPSSLLSSQGLSIPCSLPQYEQSFNVNSLFPAKALSLHESTSSIPLSVSTTTSVSSFVQHPNINSLVATTPLYFSELFSSPSRPVICTPSLIASSLAATVEPTRVGSLNTKSLLSLLPTRLLVNSDLTTAFGLNKLLVPPLGSLNNPRPSVSVNNTSIPSIPCTEQPPPIRVQMISQSFPSITSFSSSTQGETLLPIVNSSQQKHPNSSTVHLSQPLQTLHEDTKFKVLEQKIKIESEILTPELQPPTTSMKEPLLPLPEPSHRRFNEGTFSAYHHSTGRQGRGRGYVFSEPVSRFTQDFDFTAMNEKFNKEEVWGHLGKGKGIAKYDKEGQWPSYTGKIPKEHEESLHLEIKPVYHKDDFFDQLSYNERKPSCPESENSKFSGQLKEAKNCGDSRRHRSNRGKGGRGSRKAGRLRGSGSGSGSGYG